jgi:hypothetical protein
MANVTARAAVSSVEDWRDDRFVEAGDAVNDPSLSEKSTVLPFKP